MYTCSPLSSSDFFADFDRPFYTFSLLFSSKVFFAIWMVGNGLLIFDILYFISDNCCVELCGFVDDRLSGRVHMWEA